MPKEVGPEVFEEREEAFNREAVRGDGFFDSEALNAKPF